MSEKILNQRFQKVQETCLEHARILKQNLFAGVQFKLPKQIMELNSEILNLSSEWSRNFPKNAHSQKDATNDGMEDKLINLYKQCLNEFVTDLYEQFKETQNQKDITLQLVAKHYHDYKAYSYWLYKIFYHLDSSTLSTVGADLHSISLEAIQKGYFKEGKEKLFSTILDVLLESRQQEILLDKKVKSLCELFIVMDAKTVRLKYEREQSMYDYICLNFQETEQSYRYNFENKFIDETKKFYKVQISERKNLGAIEFVRWALKVIQLEEQMSLESYSKSFDKIKNTLNQLFVKEQAQRLSTTAVQYLLSVDGITQLGELYNLISREKDCVKFIAEEFTTYFLSQVRQVNQNISDQSKQQSQGQNKQVLAENLCNQILEIMEKAKDIIKTQMQNSSKLIQAYQNAFTTAFNEVEEAPFYVALFADMLIKSDKGINEIETDIKLNKIFSLFQLLYQRDKFLQHHQKFLSSRLLNQTNQNLNLEKNLLQKFKGETQTNVLAQLQNMVNDIQQSLRFISDQQIHKNQKFELSVYLLSFGCWPIGKIKDEIIPPLQMINSLSLYEQIYQEKNNGRILQWTFNYGSGEINYKIQNDKYYFSVTTLQIISFLQFNKEDQLTIKQIYERTQINQIDLENSLIPFICNKILQRQKQDLDAFSDQNEIIKLNLAFNNKQKRIKMLPNSKMQPKRERKLGELTQEEKEYEEQLIKQREFVVDSQLVRTMKSKKTIKHSDLLSQCQQMITIFKPDIKFVKKRIENLIERGFIKRDEVDCNLYHYLN
ncbi:unnamed protein product [Paramecium primaurelia]|uniref:Cullin family profile domain-containing protein n=1 Tax=Paramecium primaurelia TaxID=5886 RepID=A0A8S1JMT7_PARPR|nr:unnamed protein product [Paramecium primaurelia]